MISQNNNLINIHLSQIIIRRDTKTMDMGILPRWEANKWLAMRLLDIQIEDRALATEESHHLATS